MPKIIFLSEFDLLFQSWQNQKLHNNARGGTAYEYEAILALQDNHQVEVEPRAIRSSTERTLNYMSRLFFLNNTADLLIKTPAVVLYGRKNSKIKEIAMIHHIYFAEKRSSLKGKLSLSILQHKLRRVDCVVAVSEYWHQYFLQIGCKNVKTIYNSFNINDYAVTPQEMEDFRIKYKLDESRPVLYLGLNKYGKGVKEVYQALKACDYQLVTTGDSSQAAEVPIDKLDLSKREYICLLNAVDATVLMPTIEEGWSRVAHESLLCRTPVIGSGIAGMRELLEKGKQVICPDLAMLPSLLDKVLINKEQYADDGYKYVRQFDLAYFKREWLSLIDSL